MGTRKKKGEGKDRPEWGWAGTAPRLLFGAPNVLVGTTDFHHPHSSLLTRPWVRTTWWCLVSTCLSLCYLIAVLPVLLADGAQRLCLKARPANFGLNDLEADMADLLTRAIGMNSCNKQTIYSILKKKNGNTVLMSWRSLTWPWLTMSSL